jgi:hypothetical protein
MALYLRRLFFKLLMLFRSSRQVCVTFYFYKIILSAVDIGLLGSNAMWTSK